MKNILVTGAAGFIGSNLVKRLFKDLTDATIVGIDNMNDYYDVSLKEYRLKELETLHSYNPCNSWSVPLSPAECITFAAVAATLLTLGCTDAGHRTALA